MKDRSEYYRKTRQKNEEAAVMRLEKLYTSVPEAKKADDDMALLNIELIRMLTSAAGDKQSAVKRLNGEIAAAAGHRKEILVKAGFAPDHTDVKYDCPRCNDTGVLESGGSCNCFLP
jgi:DNA replication protein DnaC